MHEIRIPKYGMSTIEVDIVAVHAAVGQSVAIGDPIADIDTEKVSMVLESDSAGTVVEILVKDGDTAQVGDVVCRLG